MTAYEAEQIKVLTGLSAVRKRPGMYVGDIGLRGLHHIVFEVVDNSIDEAMAGYCTKIEVTIHPDESITIVDNGRGIPVSIHPKFNVPAVEVVLTKLHAGGKFDQETYKISGGLHGVGVSATNALSEFLIVKVRRNGKVYQQRFERGDPVTTLEVIGDATETGTTITFKPDQEIFPETIFHLDIIAKRLRELAFLNTGVNITLEDERTGKKQLFSSTGGIQEFVKFIDENKTPLHPDIIYFQKTKDKVILEVAMRYNTGYQSTFLAFVNNINTEEGGTHVLGFRMALTRVMNSYLKEGNGKGDKVSGDDVREGLTAIISIKMPDPLFEGQTKTKLGNSEIQSLVSSVVGEELNNYFNEHPQTARLLTQKCLEAFLAREAARKARDMTRRKSVLEGSNLPGKLADCSNTDPAATELFVVEGDSAGGSARQGRDRTFQAVLPLRGKILNVEKSRLHKILQNKEIVNLITALGTGISDEFDLKKLRYHKIIIMTDADVDGSHIMTLLLTFFYRYMPHLIEQGHMYVAQPPLYRLQKGKMVKYAYSDQEKEEISKGLDNLTLQRYKGLGEMNPPQLWETTMDPLNRVLKQITIEDAIEADRIFTILMGDEVEPRRQFIEQFAKEVVNLDV